MMYYFFDYTGNNTLFLSVQKFHGFEYFLNKKIKKQTLFLFIDNLNGMLFFIKILNNFSKKPWSKILHDIFIFILSRIFL